jgi:hypothetical protein
MQQNRRGGGSGWFGWIIFLFLIFGTRFLPPVANWLSQVTGLSITPPLIIAAVVVLGVVISVGSSILQTVNQSRNAGDTRLPTGMPPSSPPPPMSPPPSARIPPPSTRIPPPMSSRSSLGHKGMGQPQLPRPPRFEPIIDPRILAFGVIGLIAMSIIFFVALIVLGAI